MYMYTVHVASSNGEMCLLLLLPIDRLYVQST